MWKWKFKLIFILIQLSEMYEAGRVNVSFQHDNDKALSLFFIENTSTY